MSLDFYKFPTTPHLADLGGNMQRQDKVFSIREREAFLSHPVVVEEKVDGANLGISFDDTGLLLLQNRGGLLHSPFTGQWKMLERWIALRVNALFDALGDQLLLFGEWCYARHSTAYQHLPDYFLGFDVFDKQHRVFYSTSRRDQVLHHAGVTGVPRLAQGFFSLNDLASLLCASRYGAEAAEGLYLRNEDAQQLHVRAKLVRPEFMQTMDEHWSRKVLIPNKLMV